MKKYNNYSIRIFLILLIIISFTYDSLSKTAPKINGFKDKKPTTYTPEEGVYVDVDHDNIFYDKKNFQQQHFRTKKAGKLEYIDDLAYKFETKETLSRLEVEYNLPAMPEITHGDYDNFQFIEIQLDKVSIGKCVTHRRQRNYWWPAKIFSTFCLGEMYNVQKGKHEVTLKIRGYNYHLYLGYYDTPPSVTLVGEFMKKEDKKAFIIPKVEKTVRVRSLPSYTTSNTYTNYIVFPGKWMYRNFYNGWHNNVKNMVKIDMKFLPAGKLSVRSYHQANRSGKKPNMMMMSAGYYDENNVFRILQTDPDYWSCGKKLWNDSEAYVNKKFKDWNESKNQSVAAPRNIYNKSMAIGDKMGSNRWFFCNRSIDSESYYKLSTVYVEPYGDGTVDYIKVNKKKVDIEDKNRHGLIQVTGDDIDDYVFKAKDVIEIKVSNKKSKENMMMAAVFYKGKDGITKEINSDQYLKCTGSAYADLKQPKISDKDTTKKQQYEKFGYFSSLYPYIKYYIGKKTSSMICRIKLPDI